MSHVPDTTPYPWPYDGDLDPQRTALVLAGGGSWMAARVPADRSASANIATLRAAVRAAGGVVVVVEHRPPSVRLATVEAHSTPLAAGDDEVAVTASGLDGFYGSGLDATLRAARRSHLVVCGLGLETAVHSTLRRANDRGYECLLVADASIAHDPALVAASTSSVEMSGGIFGAVGATAAVLAAFG